MPKLDSATPRQTVQLVEICLKELKIYDRFVVWYTPPRYFVAFVLNSHIFSQVCRGHRKKYLSAVQGLNGFWIWWRSAGWRTCLVRPASWGSGAWRRLRRTRTSLPGRGAVWNEFRVESLTVWVPFFVESKRLQVSQIRTVLWVVSMCWFWDILSGVAPCTAASAFCGSADGRGPTWTMLVIVLQFQSLKRAAIPNQSNAPFDARRVEVLVNRHWPFHACKHQTVCFATICATVRWPWCVYQLTGVPEGPRMATSNSRCKSFSKIPSVQK